MINSALSLNPRQDELLKLVETEHKRLGNANKTLKSKGTSDNGMYILHDQVLPLY